MLLLNKVGTWGCRVTKRSCRMCVGSSGGASTAQPERLFQTHLLPTLPSLCETPSTHTAFSTLGAVTTLDVSKGHLPTFGYRIAFPVPSWS